MSSQLVDLLETNENILEVERKGVIISIIIPVFNDGQGILKLVEYLRNGSDRNDLIEIIVVDASSTDDGKIEMTGSDVKLIRSKIAQRAAQMNLGAKSSVGEILYFLHADSVPPLKFDKLIRNIVQEKQTDFGCFRLSFDLDNCILSFYSYFSRFSQGIFHGGDASLFVRRTLYNSVNGFDTDLTLMEDYDIIKRLKKIGKFIVLPEKVTTSARKYKDNGVIKLQWNYFILQLMFRMKADQIKMIKYYKRKIK